jgi:hypothetical protein
VPGVAASAVIFPVATYSAVVPLRL